MSTPLDQFIAKLRYSIEQDTFVKLLINDKREQSEEVKSITIRKVLLKKGYRLSFVFRYPTKDITKNVPLDVAISEVQKLVQDHYKQAALMTSDADYHLTGLPKGLHKLKTRKATQQKEQSASHDRQKERFIGENAAPLYLQKLGIANELGSIRQDRRDKFRQINKYVEIVHAILKQSSLNGKVSVADMGAGKGYLTFALYDHLVNTLNMDVHMKGVEFRPELVELCNGYAQEVSFANLVFEAGSIASTELNNIDVLIALHACDTATDDAIYKGITEGAEVIICSPCCHKQVRKAMQTPAPLNAITQHGILLERQAEMVTDTIRALLLEANGYKTKVIEFISTSHTPKNLLISAVKRANTQVNKLEHCARIDALKQAFGVSNHYLEDLLEPSIG